MESPQPTPGLLKFIYTEFKGDYTFAKKLVKALISNMIAICIIMFFIILIFFAAKLGGAN